MKKTHLIFSVLLLFSVSSSAQFGKLKGMMGGKKDTTKVAEPKTEETNPDQPKKSGGGGFMNKVMSKVAKGAFTIGAKVSGSDMLGSTDDLNTVDLSVSLMQNLHPTEVQEIGQDFFNGWEPAGSGIIMMFTSKTKLQFTKLQGDVKIDGVPANYSSMGLYTSFTKGKEAKKIDITSKSGQNLSFTINAPKQKIKLLSVNGQKANATLDMSKDVVLEFAAMPEDTKTPIMVQLTGTTLGMKTFYAVGWFAPKTKIVIPPAMFRQMGASGRGFNNCYLQVSRGKMETASNITGVSQNIKVGSIVHDGMFVNVTNKPTFSKGLEAKGVEGTSNYLVKKEPAMMSRDFGSMKTLGVMGFAAKGSTSFYDRKTKYVMGGGYETTEKIAKFPQLPSSVWDQVLAKLYTQISEVLTQEFNVNVVDLEKITGSAAYKVAKTYDVPETNTRDEFFITYKNTKALSPFRPIAEMGGLNSPEHKVMEEVGVNALLKLTLGFQMNFEGNSAFMVPSLSFEITGPMAGDLYPTTYLTGTVVGKDFHFNKKIKLETYDDLEIRALDLNGMTAAFRKAMQDIKAKEKADGDYEIEWKAMNQ